MTSTPLLQLSDISFERDDRLLFSAVNASVAAGDILQVSGDNGSGKTTLLKVIIGTLAPQSGDCLWRGTPVHQCALEYASELLYIGHQPGIKSTLTPEENLCWLQRLSLAEKSSHTIADALGKVGLVGYEDVPCHSLSAGQQRRVALARLYLSTVKLWILDEPFTAIDRQGVTQLEQCMQQHVSEGGAVILTTHQPLSIDGVKTLHLGAGHSKGEQ
ncbi:cytochrome c biogenesis heme-transporting ATPase CcmA [Porticoccus sp. W117]|uniref:cytochrome c biogenesis heme-transporting ATPase CcmA n=1 Tax=Porticoccus sp. W117 TaxID=3054777 RepID=UPI0025935075|nr:cytochrome c biogenesis heme-transporting ATPase CcmA [Porticoccus sp. W117]MDM3869783.1 cytochrome c biogenesis heme-transporting ATPase CcmA [Porticoccus sp. W117]